MKSFWKFKFIEKNGSHSEIGISGCDNLIVLSEDMVELEAIEFLLQLPNLLPVCSHDEWPRIGHMRPTCHTDRPWNLAGRPRLVAPPPFPHWILLLPTYFDTWWKQFLEIHQDLAGWPRVWGRLAPLWVGWARALCYVVPSCHIVREHPWFSA
jgi:hypothetical protein